MSLLRNLKFKVVFKPQLSGRLMTALFLLVIVALVSLHFEQQREITASMAQLQTIRDARIDLAKGVLYVSMDKRSDLPFRGDEGLLLIKQALATLDQELHDLSTASGQEIADHHRNQLQVAGSKVTEAAGAQEHSPRNAVALRVHFQFLEEQAANLDVMVQQRLKKLSDNLNLQFNIALTISASLLIGLYLFLRSAERARVTADALIWRQNNYDGLTNLPNRRLFLDRLAAEVRKAEAFNSRLALCVLDLDRFQEVNDTLGHQIGDKLLIEAAYRIKSQILESDTLTRHGGDEFALILPDLVDFSDIERSAQKILSMLSASYSIDGEEIFISASMGIALYPDDASSIEDLVKNADQAMYVAKREGRNRLTYFTPAMQESAQLRRRLVADMRSAIAENQFQVFYQPIIDLKSEEVIKAEALMRWTHKELGSISPATFIPIAEDTGLIHALGDWIFLEATRQLKRWKITASPNFQISINKSPTQFHADGKAHDHWLDQLEGLKLPAGSVVIEITEGLLLNADDRVGEKLNQFRAAGIQIAIDDFGTGYSALSYIKKFHVDYLKIDQSFTKNLEVDSSDLALCNAIISMAHTLGIKVIAEGVETVEQERLLRKIDCDFAQGYLYSKPLPANEFDDYLRSKNLNSSIAAGAP